MEISLNEIEKILRNTRTTEIESSIAKQVGCDIYKDDLPFLAGFIKEEIESSQLSIDEIESYIDDNKESIIAFGVKFLEKSKPESLSTGIVITYSIYLIYLKEKDEKEFLEYLKRRRIPKPKKLLEQLLEIKMN
jgi:chaperonin cofactor prefoldin